MTGLIQVASFPADHPYIDAVRPGDVRAVVPGESADPTPWAPHPWWDPAVLRRAVGDIDVDVLHVHFGYDHLTPDELSGWLAGVRDLALPLVVTVHDLRNPHHPTAERHDEHLGLLLAAADAVLTLTPGAAQVVTDRWARRPTVVAHPGLVEPPPRPHTDGPPVVGIHLKSLRRNLCDPDRIVLAALRGAQAGGGRLRVDVHPDVVERPELVLTRERAAAGALTLSVHERFADHQLVGYLQELAVSVLPNRFGTHSGWLEACRDVGTRVVAPDCGYYADQWPAVQIYGNSEAAGLDADSLAAAVTASLADPVPAPADPGWRAEQRRAVQRAHLEVYTRVRR